MSERKAAQESGDIDSWVRARAVEVETRRQIEEFGRARGRGGQVIKYNPDLHPRDREGQFRKVLAKLKKGDVVKLPTGAEVVKTGHERYQVKGGRSWHSDQHRIGKRFAVADALHRHDATIDEKIVGKMSPGESHKISGIVVKRTPDGFEVGKDAINDAKTEFSKHKTVADAILTAHARARAAGRREEISGKELVKQKALGVQVKVKTREPEAVQKGVEKADQFTTGAYGDAGPTGGSADTVINSATNIQTAVTNAATNIISGGKSSPGEEFVKAAEKAATHAHDAAARVAQHGGETAGAEQHSTSAVKNIIGQVGEPGTMADAAHNVALYGKGVAKGTEAMVAHADVIAKLAAKLPALTPAGRAATAIGKVATPAAMGTIHDAVHMLTSLFGARYDAARAARIAAQASGDTDAWVRARAIEEAARQHLSEIAFFDGNAEAYELLAQRIRAAGQAPVADPVQRPGKPADASATLWEGAYDAAKHPRGRKGQWIDVMGRLGNDEKDRSTAQRAASLLNSDSNPEDVLSGITRGADGSYGVGRYAVRPQGSRWHVEYAPKPDKASGGWKDVPVGAPMRLAVPVHVPSIFTGDTLDSFSSEDAHRMTLGSTVTLADGVKVKRTSKGDSAAKSHFVVSKGAASRTATADDVPMTIESVRSLGAGKASPGEPRSFDVGITPYRGKSSPGQDYYETPRAKGFENALSAIPEVVAYNRARGVWAGGGEPSYEVHLRGTPDAVRRITDRLAADYNQDATIAWRPNPEGTSRRLTSQSVVDPAKVEKLLGSSKYHAIPGATMTHDGRLRVIVVDAASNPKNMTQAIELFQELGADHDFERGDGELRFAGKDYQKRGNRPKLSEALDAMEALFGPADTHRALRSGAMSNIEDDIDARLIAAGGRKVQRAKGDTTEVAFIASPDKGLGEAFVGPGSDAWELGQDMGQTVTFDPAKHPRDRLGKFIDLLNNTDGYVRLPSGVEVHYGWTHRYIIKDRQGNTHRVKTAEDTAKLALALDASAKK